MREKTLSQIDVGASARVSSLSADGGMRRRLLDIGFTGGAKVACLFESPSGDPRAYFIRGAVVALRRKDAERVNVARP